MVWTISGANPTIKTVATALIGNYDAEVKCGGTIYDNTATDFAARLGDNGDVYAAGLSGKASAAGMLAYLNKLNPAAPRVTGTPAAVNCIQNEQSAYSGAVTIPTITISQTADQVTPAGFIQKFKELYERAERNTKLRKKTFKAAELFGKFMQERKDTGRIYLMNVDHANTHSPFKEDLHPIKMSNLCTEIDLPTKPLMDINDELGRIALCTLSAQNWGNVKKPQDFERMCTLAVRGLDALLSYQNYPVRAAEIATKEFRPIGNGIINFAYFLAKHDVNYSDPAALALVDEYAEAWSYYLIKASADLAKEQGPCEKWEELKYADGLLPIDTRKKEVDELVEHKERMPWRALREQILTYGIRNATLMALMPAETSAQISNATNGIEAPRGYVSIKQSKHGVLKQVVPEFKKLKNKYELLWDQRSPEGYLKLCAVLQKYIDQGISVNTSYNPKYYEDEKIPMSEMLKHLIMCYKYGTKQLYYFNTNDGQGEIDVDKLSTSLQTPTDTEMDQEDCDSCVI